MFVFAHQNVLEILCYFAIAYMLACSEHLWTAWVFLPFWHNPLVFKIQK